MLPEHHDADVVSRRGPQRAREWHMSRPFELMDWIARIEAEYHEMPGLQLTEPQMRRLWGLDSHTCAHAVEVLVSQGVLRETAGHAYALATPAR